jgi:hypothetical protein
VTQQLADPDVPPSPPPAENQAAVPPDTAPSDQAQ